MEWLQTNGTLSRSEWRDGLFALKAGIEDPQLLDEMVCRWTMNKSYVQGDEHEARSIVARATTIGGVGPGTIFKILNDVKIREGAPIVETPFTIQEILDRSRVHKRINKDGSLAVECSDSNAAALIGAIFDEKTLYHDTRSDLYIYKGKSYSDSELVSIFLPMLQSPAYGLGLEKFRRNTVASGLDVLMAARKRDPHREYVQGLQWDGVQRIEHFFTKYAGVPDSEYIRLVGTNMWTALAARSMDPGCKLDSMIILEGKEGIRKSSLIEAIAGGYTYAPIKKEFVNDLDVLRQMHQSVITELPELIGIVGQSPLQVKAFLAKPFDNIRNLYARKAMRSDRSFILMGTTNDEKYLALDMGSRRFWPVKIPAGSTININMVKEDRDQLWAEGIARWRDGHLYWNMPKELLAPIVEEKVVEEPLAGPIRECLESLGPTFMIVDIYRRLEAGGYVNKGLTSQTSYRIEQVLKRMGCEREGGYWVNKKTVVSQLVQTMASYASQSTALGAFI
jgi:hypothetical protein